MWGDPRPGTDAHKVNKLVEKRKQEAQTNGFDRLLCDVYFDILKTYPTWIKNEHNNVGEYIHPSVVSSEQIINGISFRFADKIYRIETDRKYGYDNPYYEVNLFLNNNKVFGINATEDADTYATFYYPRDIISYVNSDWVNDFKAIQHHSKLISKKREIQWAEDQERTNEKRNNFGISEEAVVLYKDNDTTKNNNTIFWKQWWFWIVITVGLMLLFD